LATIKRSFVVDVVFVAVVVVEAVIFASTAVTASAFALRVGAIVVTTGLVAAVTAGAVC